VCNEVFQEEEGLELRRRKGREKEIEELEEKR
jgi:hypothetical protein